MNVAVSGNSRWRFSTSYFGASDNGRAAIVQEDTTSTNPVFVPGGQNDDNTGIGRNAADELSLKIGRASCRERV